MTSRSAAPCGSRIPDRVSRRWRSAITCPKAPTGGPRAPAPPGRAWRSAARGRLRLESGPGGDHVLEAGPGDFLRVPAGAVHRESNPSDEQARVVVVKSRGHFRGGFDEFFNPAQIYEVDCPGLTSPILANFTWTKLPRPVYPLDEEASEACG